MGSNSILSTEGLQNLNLQKQKPLEHRGRDREALEMNGVRVEPPTGSSWSRKSFNSCPHIRFPVQMTPIVSERLPFGCPAVLGPASLKRGQRSEGDGSGDGTQSLGLRASGDSKAVASDPALGVGPKLEASPPAGGS